MSRFNLLSVPSHKIRNKMYSTLPQLQPHALKEMLAGKACIIALGYQRISGTSLREPTSLHS